LALEQERIERERRLHLEQQRRLEQERARVREHEEQEHRERERKLKEEREQQRQEQERRERQEQERRERQEQERRERERRERVEEERAKRDREQKREREEMEREKILQHPQRLGKRPFGGDMTSYESAKRQAVHDLRGVSDGYSSSPSSVFGRLDPPTQNRSDTSSIQPLMARPGGDYRRSEQDGDHSHSYERPSRGATGSLYRTSGYSSRERHSADGAVYPIQEATTSRTVPQTANVYGKVMSGLSASSAGHSSVQQLVKQRQSAETTALSRVPTEIINAATQALENIRKSVASAGGQVPGTKLSPGARIPQVPSSLPPHFQQLAASAAAVSSRTAPNFLSINPRVALSPGTGRQGMLSATANPGATVLGKYSPQVKLPPEDERYNNPRRFSRPGGHQRQSTYKRLI